jgi:uncharacterized protein YcfL
LKKTFIVLFAVFVCSACSSVGNNQITSDRKDCLSIQQTSQKNTSGLADDLFIECLDKKQQQQEKNQESVFWEKSFEFVLSFFDAIKT